ncbi:MAG: 4Fe-4S dicluster domain-containing protein [Candidatus Schekmanbacteria bacterium]|nr:MAG: 4Fe-4S dicluster domain-containing protein [Candidatus Schekmanbacteria bacterium]
MIKSTLINAAIKILVKGDIEIRSYLCPTIKSPKSHCKLCVETCPADAIRLADEIIDEKKCFNCGICVSVCPAGVYSSRNQPDSKIVEEAKSAAVKKNDSISLTFSCGMVEDENETYKLKCLGRLNENIILWLKRMGIDEISFNRGNCGDCTLSAGYTVFKQNLRLSRLIEDSLGNDFWKKYKELSQSNRRVGKEGGVSRRDFFRAIRGKGLLKVGELVEDLSEKDKKSDIKKKGESPRRRLLKKIILPADKAAEEIEASGGIMLPFADALINDFCIACDVCAMLCPTAAIRKVTVGGEFKIQFYYDRCFNCGLCSEVCLTKAIELKSIFDAKRLETSSPKILKSFIKKICDLCGQEFGAVYENEAICYMCRKVGKSSNKM